MIKNLTLVDFRNHPSGRVVTSGHKNIIITGPNGSGKTAILEAVSMLSGDRGMRGAVMTDVARFDGVGGFSIFAELSDDTEVSVYFNTGDSNRRAKIDGDNATLSDLANQLRIVWLTPKEDRLFIDSASDRRPFFDRLISGFDASHSGRAARLSKLLSERAFALKNNADNNWLNAIESQIASTAVSVAAARVQYAAEINYFLENAAVTVTGQLESDIINKPAGDLEKEYLKYLSENRELVGDKMIVDGPHKSDFGVFNKVLNLPVYVTSTGQQKSVLIDLILAHAKLIHAKTNKTPIILLDEAAAHLDSNARKRLFDELYKTNAQVWATGLNPDIFKDIQDVAFVTCNNGVIDNIVGP